MQIQQLTDFNEHIQMKRIVITTNDVVFLTGKSESYAQKLIRSIKDAYQKEKHQMVTIREFSEHMAIPYEEVFNMVNGIKDQSA